MPRLPPAVAARIRAKARLEEIEQEERSGERPTLRKQAPTPEDKLRWLGSETLRAPSEGTVDVVKLGPKRR